MISGEGMKKVVDAAGKMEMSNETALLRAAMRGEKGSLMKGKAAAIFTSVGLWFALMRGVPGEEEMERAVEKLIPFIEDIFLLGWNAREMMELREMVGEGER